MSMLWSIQRRIQHFGRKALGIDSPGFLAVGSTRGSDIKTRLNGDPKRALEAMSGPVGIGVDMISDDCAAIRCDLYLERPQKDQRPLGRSRKSMRAWEPLPNHPASRLIAKPYPGMSEFFLRYITVAWLLLTGNALWWKVRLTPGDPKSEIRWLWPIPFHWAERKYNPDGSLRGWAFRPEYKVRDWLGNVVKEIPASDVIHWMKPNPLNLRVGRGRVEMSAVEVDLDWYMQLTNLGFFVNGAQIGGAIIVDNWKDESIKAWQQDFQRYHAGPGKAHRWMFFQKGWDVKPEQAGKSDSDWIEGSNLVERRIYKNLRIPPAVLGDISEYHRANLEGAMWIYQERCLLPWMRFYCQTIENELLSDKTFDAGFSVYHYEHDDFVIRNEEIELKRRQVQLGQGTGLPTIVVNEARDEDGLDPILHSAAETLYRNQSLLGADEERPAPQVTIGPPGGGQPAEDPPPAAKSLVSRSRQRPELTESVAIAHRFLTLHEAEEEKLIKVYTRSFGEQRKGVEERAAALFGKAAGLVAGWGFEKAKAEILRRKDIVDVVFPNPDREAVRIYQDSRGVKWDSMLLSAEKTWVSLGVRDFRLPEKKDVGASIATIETELLEKWIREESMKNVVLFNRTTIQELREVYAEVVARGGGVAEFVKVLKETYDDLGRYRLFRLARTETTGNLNAAALMAAKAVDFAVVKRWIAQLDERTRDGHSIAADDYFDGIALDRDYMVANADGVYEPMKAPGDPNASAGNIVNCRCGQAFAPAA